jgi:hypothetical protein
MKYSKKPIALAALLFAAGMVHAETPTGPLQAGQRLQIGVPRGAGDPVVYDSTGGSFTTTTGVPRAYMGGAANIVGAGPQVDITSIDVFMAATTGATYTNVRARIQFWDTYTAAGTPIFSDAVGAVITADTGPVTTVTNTVTTLTINLPSPVRLNSLTNKGFAVNFQSDTGGGLADDPNLTTPLSINGAQAVGTSAVNAGNGFYRNASGRTDFNFVPGDLRTFTGITDARTSLVLRGNSSVPVMLQSFDVN